MRAAAVDYSVLTDEIRRIKCAQYGLMSLEESAYITDPVLTPYAILEAKSIIRFGINAGYYPSYYSKFLNSDDVIALRLATTAGGEVANRKLNESFGIDLALGVGQMIPGVKTFAGIAGVAYYAYQAYDSFNSGSILGGIGNIFLTLLSAAAIEPLGAAAWTGPIVTALGPLTKLGKAFESFLGLMIKGAFGPIVKLLQKVPGLRAVMKWVGGGGMRALESAGGWLSKNAARLAQWLEKQSAKYAGKAASTPQGMLGKVGKYLSGKVANAAEMMSKFITNMKIFISSGGQKGFGAAAGAEAKVAGAEVGAATKLASAEATAALKTADDAYKAALVQLEKQNPALAQTYRANPNALLDDLAKGEGLASGRYTVDAFGMKKAAEALQAAKAGVASAEAAAAGATAAGAATAGAETAAAGAGAAGAATSRITSDLGRLHSYLDAQAGKLLPKVEAMKAKQALNALKGAEPVIFTNKAGKEVSRIFMDSNGQVFRLMAKPGAVPVKVPPSEILKTQRWTKLLMDQGIPAAQAQAIGRGLTRGFSSGAGEVPDAEAAAGL